MEEIWISPNHTSSEFGSFLSIEQKIMLYEDQLNGWFLNIADQLKDEVAADFVILLIILSLIEGHSVYLTGEDSYRDSKNHFAEGFKKIIGPSIAFGNAINEFEKAELLLAAANTVYEQARCGLFHDGKTRYGIRLSRGETNKPAPPISIHIVEHNGPQVFRIDFNAFALLESVKSYFKTYFAELQESENELLRANFEKGWDILHQDILSEGGRNRFGVLFHIGVFHYRKVD